jgi:hypothetical protein
MANEQQDLEKLRSIILEPRITEIINRLKQMEDGLKQVGTSATSTVKKDIDTFRNDVEEVKIGLGGMRSDVHSLRKELDEVKNVMVGFNKKLTGAFSAFVGPKQ